MLAIKTVQKYFPKVTEVVDGTERIELLVVESDCKYGIEGDPRSCAFARAAQREHNGAIVGISTVYIVDGKKATRYRHEEGKRLKNFDKGLEELRPGTIVLFPFSATSRFGGGRKHRSISSGPRGKQKRAFHHTIAQENRTGVRVL